MGSPNKQVEHKKKVSPGNVPVTSWPLVLRGCLWLQSSPQLKDTVARTQGRRLICVTLPGVLTAALSPHHPAAGDLWVLLPASSSPPALATGSLGHDIPIHKVVTQSREETHSSGHDLNPRIPGSLRDRHRDGDHLQLWDSGDGAGGQWWVPGEPWLGE